MKYTFTDTDRQMAVHPCYFKIPLSEILAGKHPSYCATHLRRRLIEEGVKKNECERCHIKPGPTTYRMVEMHHKNGDRRDHRRRNLEFDCPNCHSLTPNYKRCKRAGVAQLEERRTCNALGAGSIPATSSNNEYNEVTRR